MNLSIEIDGQDTIDTQMAFWYNFQVYFRQTVSSFDENDEIKLLIFLSFSYISLSDSQSQFGAPLSLFTFLKELLVITFENSYYFYIKSPKLFEEIREQYFIFVRRTFKLYIAIYEVEFFLEVRQKFWLVPSLILCKQYILKMWSNSKW